VPTLIFERKIILRYINSTTPIYILPIISNKN
jgi:hypothetical protein